MDLCVEAALDLAVDKPRVGVKMVPGAGEARYALLSAAPSAPSKRRETAPTKEVDAGKPAISSHRSQ